MNTNDISFFGQSWYEAEQSENWRIGTITEKLNHLKAVSKCVTMQRCKINQ